VLSGIDHAVKLSRLGRLMNRRLSSTTIGSDDDPARGCESLDRDHLTRRRGSRRACSQVHWQMIQQRTIADRPRRPGGRIRKIWLGIVEVMRSLARARGHEGIVIEGLLRRDLKPFESHSGSCEPLLRRHAAWRVIAKAEPDFGRSGWADCRVQRPQYLSS